jgi:5'-nucleotidase
LSVAGSVVTGNRQLTASNRGSRVQFGAALRYNCPFEQTPPLPPQQGSPQKIMRVLVSNDDGVDAPGIRVLASRLSVVGEVTVVAPDRDRSGASNSLTLDQPIRVTRLDDGRYRVAGTPTDCVHLALAGLLDHEPDIVVSGINNSANLGDDVIYSGTVSAAMEGRFLGLPAIAVSLASKDHKGEHFHTAAQAALAIMQRLLVDPLPADTILNVNVPDLPLAEIRGFAVTRLGKRHRSAPCIAQRDPRGRPIYWIGPPGEAEDDGPGTDFHAVREGYISITPIQVDLTRFQALEKVSGWVESLSLELGAAGA